jgi:hypothetical protein
LCRENVQHQVNPANNIEVLDVVVKLAYVAIAQVNTTRSKGNEMVQLSMPTFEDIYVDVQTPK